MKLSPLLRELSADLTSWLSTRLWKVGFCLSLTSWYHSVSAVRLCRWWWASLDRSWRTISPPALVACKSTKGPSADDSALNVTTALWIFASPSSMLLTRAWYHSMSRRRLCCLDLLACKIMFRKFVACSTVSSTPLMEWCGAACDRPRRDVSSYLREQLACFKVVESPEWRKAVTTRGRCSSNFCGSSAVNPAGWRGARSCASCQRRAWAPPLASCAPMPLPCADHSAYPRLDPITVPACSSSSNNTRKTAISLREASTDCRGGRGGGATAARNYGVVGRARCGRKSSETLRYTIASLDL